jgi:DNA-binding response OmpR family regulator
MKVLIADDEHQYRSHISKALERTGHQVETAETGYTAIEKGLVFRPDVLVADWLFRDQLHGIHVATALQSVLPRMKTVLISGFASEDLSLDAGRAGIHCFLEKPFDIAEVTEAVESGSMVEDLPRTSGYAMVDVDGALSITWANDHAAALLAPGDADEVTGPLDSCFGPGGAEDFEKSRTMWVKMKPGIESSSSWFLRSRQIGDATLTIVITEELQDRRSHPVLKNVLGIQTHYGVSWPLTDRVIVIDDSSAVRHVYQQILERAGCVSYRAGDHDLAIRLLREDSRLTVAVVDFDMPGVDTNFLIDELRSIRPDIKIVGSSGEDHRTDFKKMGVERYLGKPWHIQDLVDVLRVQ